MQINFLDIWPLFLGLVIGLSIARVLWWNRLNAQLTRMTVELGQKQTEAELMAAHLAEERAKMARLFSERQELERALANHLASEDARRRSYEEKISAITLAISAHEGYVARLRAEEETQRQSQREAEKRTWQTHEAHVEQAMRALSRELGIEYSDEFPLKDPDNVVKIAGEYVIFDAKSPRGEDVSSFVDYLKEQAKAIKKYLGVKDVRRELFLVIPDNCIHVVKSWHFPFPDYQVYIVCASSLAFVLLMLKRIEDYEFANALSPTERDQIVSYIGKASYLLKRRIQVDNYFAHESLGLLSQKENLPEEFFIAKEAVERSAVYNPPLDKTKKTIALEDLTGTLSRIEKEDLEISPVFNPYEI